MRGIGVAVSTSMSTASPLRASASRWCTPKRCCSSTIGEREIAERDLVLEQRVGADQQIDLAEREPVERLVALLAALAAGEDGDADAGLLGERRDGGEMLAREDFGRRHQRGLPAGLDHGRGGEQRHHGLAGADVALQQPQHALRAARDR